MGSKIKIGTHDGLFHCDEILAYAIIKHSKPEYNDAEIVRSEKMDILNDCDIIVDVGEVYDPSCHRYDHHPKPFTHTMNTLNNEYPWNIKLSSAGLVYFHFGHGAIANILKLPTDSEEVKILFKKVYENFIREFDALDDEVPFYPTICYQRYEIHPNLRLRVRLMYPRWNAKNPDETKSFKKACKIVEKEFLDRVTFYGKLWLPARDIVMSAIKKRFSVHSSGEIIELATGRCPWKEHLFELEESFKVEKPIKFIIYADKADNTWKVQCVPTSSFSFENRLSLCKEWCGLRDGELIYQCGIDGSIFVHSNGYIGENKTREGALEMAVKTLIPKK